MSDIVLSSSVRQNLLSLQSTAEMLATTQTRLATGKKVNSALDNPTNYFTAAGLDARASDINNLLDGIGNGVQVIQAANTGITSLQKLVDTAKSIANQALQTQVGYSSKSSVTTAAIAGATAEDLRGGGAATNAAATAGSAITSIDLSTPASPATSASATAAAVYAGAEFVGDGSANDSITIGGTTVTFDGTQADGTTAIADSTNHKYTLQEAVDKINAALTAASSTISAAVGTGADAGKIVLTNSATGTASNFTITQGGSNAGNGGFGTSAIDTASTVAPGITAGANAVPHADMTFDVNGETVTLAGGSSYTGTQIASAIQSQVGSSAGVTASYTNNRLVITSTGTAGASDSVTVDNAVGGALSDLGFTGTSVTANGANATGGLDSLTLEIAATGGGTATSITFGDGTGGTVKSLNDLNKALAANNLQATLSTDGKITITTSNDAASATIGAITGTATDSGEAFNGLAGGAPVVDANAQATRANLVTQYNNIIQQITTTSQDASFNGVNLLNGDQLKLTFNETGKSTLNITGVNFNPAGLGLSTLTAGTDFIDNAATNKVLTSLNNASSTLRSQASALGSNLSIVQIRQDFSKSLINVLQTGSANLTLADTNEEAANSQALATRQSIAVSALALANTSQQSVLQLLR